MPETTKITRSAVAAKSGIKLKTGKVYNVKLTGPGTVYVIEVEDVLFRHDSAVLLPEAYEDPESAEAESPEQEKISGLDAIRTVFLRAKEFPKQTLLIAGHTDTTGKDAYNLKLSQLRANSVLYMLQGEREKWAEICDAKHKNEDIQQILTWANRCYPGFDCDPQGIDGDIGTNTRKATRNFQTNFAWIFKRKIGVDGTVGKETWGAFFDVYQAQLAQQLDIEESKLADYRSAVKWADSAHQAVGCGENWPIEKADEDEYRSRINRRVEFLFFDENEAPKLKCHDQPDGSCDKAQCLLYPPENFKRVHLPVHPHAHPQSIPVIKVPRQPGSTVWIQLKNLFVYVAFFQGKNLDMGHSQKYIAIDGKLCGPVGNKPLPIDCDREAWFYASNRGDLMDSDKAKRFKKDGTGLPLVGPIKVPCGQDVEVQVDIWKQNDWVVIEGLAVDGRMPDGMLLADWNENYTVGWVGVNKEGKPAAGMFWDQREKMKQEKWEGLEPLEMTNFTGDKNAPLWVATLSAMKAAKAKAIMLAGTVGAPWHVTSFNELAPTGKNNLFKSYHTYDKGLTDQLWALPDEDILPSAIDKLPKPPARCLLPGDICWHDQGETNYCGAYSFAACMNYWRPTTCNPGGKNGAYWHTQVDYLLIPNGARTPSQVADAAKKQNMFGRDNSAESLAKSNLREYALKLIKLWIQAGVPVMVLVEESYNTFSLHWKVIVGYDGDRFFIVNSGANDEIKLAQRHPGTNYDTAPVGNDVDNLSQLYNKWRSAGGGIVDAFSTVDTCTFIPIFPKDPKHASNKAT